MLSDKLEKTKNKTKLPEDPTYLASQGQGWMDGWMDR